MNQFCEKVKKEFNVYLSKDFNIFNYIKPSENRQFDIIAKNKFTIM